MTASAALAGLVLVATGQWPIPGPIVAPYDPPAADWQAGHRGIDLAATPGEPVRSMAAGTVAFVGSIGGIAVVTVGYPGSTRLRSTYEPVIGSVRVGQRVAAGEVIGTVAASGGHCGGSCLHVGLRTDSRYLDPTLLVTRRPAVLRPAR